LQRKLKIALDISEDPLQLFQALQLRIHLDFLPDVPTPRACKRGVEIERVYDGFQILPVGVTYFSP
jgi:hypothetical protein